VLGLKNNKKLGIMKPVNLSQIADELGTIPEEYTLYINKKTGETRLISPEDEDIKGFIENAFVIADPDAGPQGNKLRPASDYDGLQWSKRNKYFPIPSPLSSRIPSIFRRKRAIVFSFSVVSPPLLYSS
jgi:hypothetical protein